MIEAASHALSSQTLDRRPVAESAAVALEQQVDVMGTEIERSIVEVRTRRQDLAHGGLRSFYQVALSIDADMITPDRIVRDLQDIAAQVQQSVSALQARLEALVQEEIVRAVDAALGDSSKPARTAPS